MSEAWQARRWLIEADPSLLTPMIRIRSSDFYVFEPSLLGDDRICVPYRWFLRHGQIYAKAWHFITTGSGRATGWVVDSRHPFEIAASDLLVPFPTLAETFEVREMIDPRHIVGKCFSKNSYLR